MGRGSTGRSGRGSAGRGQEKEQADRGEVAGRCRREKREWVLRGEEKGMARGAGEPEEGRSRGDGGRPAEGAGSGRSWCGKKKRRREEEEEKGIRCRELKRKGKGIFARWKDQFAKTEKKKWVAARGRVVGGKEPGQELGFGG